MTLPPLTSERARHLIARFSGHHILVVGDVMLDRFIIGDVTRISPEAPVPVVRFHREDSRLGGAANVAHNLAALGARVSLAGVVGADHAADRLRDQLAKSGISPAGLVTDTARPTVEKLRIVTRRNQQVARIDYEEDTDIGPQIEQELIAAIGQLSGDADVVVVSDYLKGSITRAVVESLIARERGAVPLVIDPKIPHLDRYAGATIVTPNHHEAEAATHRRIRSDADAQAAAHDFRARANCDAALITRGEYGMWLSSVGAEGPIPAVAREVADVTGAGDTVVATLALGLAAGATLAEAAILANYAAGVVVAKFGPAIVTPAELLSAF